MGLTGYRGWGIITLGGILFIYDQLLQVYIYFIIYYSSNLILSLVLFHLFLTLLDLSLQH